LNVTTLACLALSANELAELIEQIHYLTGRIDVLPKARRRLERAIEDALPLAHWLTDAVENELRGELGGLDEEEPV